MRRVAAVAAVVLTSSREDVAVCKRLAADLRVSITPTLLREWFRTIPISARRTTRMCHRLLGWKQVVEGAVDVDAVGSEEGAV